MGGVWTFASRGALPVLGFEEPWCLLTSAHFHFAGLVLPVVAGRASRLAPSPLGALASAGVVTGVPAVAIGITAGARGHASIEWLAALLLVATALAVAAQLAWLATRSERLLPAALLALASLALCGAMALVAVYATTAWLEMPRLSLLDMALTHAPLQVFGFALPALLSLHLLPRPAQHDATQPRQRALRRVERAACLDHRDERALQHVLGVGAVAACGFRKLWHHPFRKLWHSSREEAPSSVTIS